MSLQKAIQRRLQQAMQKAIQTPIPGRLIRMATGIPNGKGQKMPTHNSVAKSVRERKEKRPELFCPESRCLWLTGGGKCPKHGGPPHPRRNAANYTERMEENS